MDNNKRDDNKLDDDENKIDDNKMNDIKLNGNEMKIDGQKIDENEMDDKNSKDDDDEMDECEEKITERIRRGYYSEIVTDLNRENDELEQDTQKQSALKRRKLKWQVMTVEHSPIVRNLEQPKTTCYLAPAERWMTYEKEKRICFPVQAFKPLVQIQQRCLPKELPRNVEIERRRRLYLSRDIKQCLDEMGITNMDLIPVDVSHRVYSGKVIRLEATIPYLPLEIFDNEEFDSRTPKGWLHQGTIDGIRHPMPGEAFLPIDDKVLTLGRSTDNLDKISQLYQWTDVAVVKYSHKTNLYSVITLDGYLRFYKIPRIYLMFKAEDPVVFAKRLEFAVKCRKESEQHIRFEFYLDCMLLTGTYEICDSWLDKIFKLALRNGHVKCAGPETLQRLEEEIRLSHKRALGEMQFRKNIAMDPKVYKFMAVPPKCIDYRPVPEKAYVDIPPYDFKQIRTHRKWVSIYCLSDVYWAIQSVVYENFLAMQTSLFTTSHIKQLPIDEFELTQIQFSKKTLGYLKNEWVPKIEKNVRLNLRHAGKGWYNIAIANPFIYDIGKCKRVMLLVKQLMQSTLRNLALQSAKQFIDLVETPCQCTLKCKKDFVWGEDLINTQFKPPGHPIFFLHLLIGPEGAYYSTIPDKFLKVLLNLYDVALCELHHIPQVQPQIFDKLKHSPNLFLSSIGVMDPEICQFRKRMVRGYDHASIPLLAYAREYDVHAELYTMVVDDYVQKYKDENHPSSEVKEEVSYQYRRKYNLEATIPVHIVIGPYFVNIYPMKNFLVQKRQEIITKLLDMFCARMKVCIEETLDEYKTIMIKLNEKPHSIEHILEIKDWMETIPMTLKQLEDVARRYILEYDVLDYFWYSLPQEDFENKWEAVKWPYKIQKQIEATNEFLIEETQRYFTMQLNDEMDLQDKIEYFTVQVTSLSAQRDYSKTHEIAVDIRRLWKSMKEAQEQGVLLNQRQKLFLVPVIPFEHLTKLIKEFEPYKNLWINASDWLRWHDIWMDNPLVNIDGESIDRTVTEMYKTMIKSMKTFTDIPAVKSVAVEIKRQIEEFKPYIPLIQAIRSPGMRQRHWEQFETETGINVVWSQNLTFNNCLDLGVADFAENIVKIAENAAKEYSIEVLLNKMRGEWDANFMELTPYKASGTFIMKVTDENLQLLDDHIVMTQQLSFSPFKGAFEQEIEEWEATLKLTTAVIEEWIELQKEWMYLEPIFTSEDISRQLPIESKKYNNMERTWRRIMRNAKENPKIIEYCNDKKLLESLKDALHLLEVVQKGLSDYLETKRNAFPRLYFLSDDELLEILSQAKNPTAVQPHLRKVFENIARLEFENDLQITKMYSADDESVNLRPTLYPTTQVEGWLVLVESSMKNTVRLTFGDSMADMAKKSRNEWVLQWPGQIVIAGCQTFWTAEVEKAILSSKLKEFFAIMLELLDGLRSLVKGTLTNLQREVLSALIVIEVHARDVTQNLLDEAVVNANDFEWIKQLRYYWIQEELKVRAVNAEFNYGYEYLGNSGRLVITPLTDRCYLTLTGALHLKFGGAPAGPAGTGKTETTKDLAKAFAIQCVVFNCSDQLDFMAMGKFFKGLASSGAWACFDEFNRIDIEVLSVVAQQITTIQKAQQARLDRFVFEGVELVLKESCSVFITMNPGYAGRTELPDNLKALFRPVAMMVPNYSLIAEISLFSFGFSDAKQLAGKITTTFKLSSEQLSSQDHYDFGMRAVKTVIAVAGNLKREKPDMDERQIVLRALRDVNVPKFLKDDLKLFNGIVSDLFPRMEELAVDYGDLELSIRSSCKYMGLEDVDDYVKKVIQLYETTVVRHGLMLVGPTGSGKTKCYEILKDAMTNLQGKPSPSGYPFQIVHTYVLNPKSITMGQLYGEFDLATHEW
ncbi:Dynein heavy chain at 36C [Carabus blaptoides fortunei]